MARRAGVILVAETAAFQRGMDQAVASAAALDGELKKLGVDAVASADAQARATETRIARLQQEAGALGRTAAAQVAAGESAVGAMAAQDRKLAQLARLQGEAGLSARESAKLNVAATMSQIDALDAEIAAYRELGAVAGATGREQQIASRFATEASASQAALLGLPAPSRISRLQGAERAGRGLSRSVTVPSLIGAGASIFLQAGFTNTLQQIVGLSGVSQQAVDRLRGAVLRLAPVVGKSPAELAKALYFITSSGIPAARSMDVLRASAKAAAAGLGDTQTVADAVTSAINAYGMKNLSAAHATDVLVATVREGKGEADAFAGSIGNVAAIAAQLDVPFNEVGAALAAITRLGIDPATASTELMRVFTTFLKTTPQSEKAFESVGLSAKGLKKELADKGFLAFLETVKKSFGGNDEALAKAFGDARALRGILALVGKQAGQTRDIFKNMSDTSGSLKTAFGAVKDDELQRFKQTLASLEVTAIHLGAALAPAAAHLASFAAKMTQAFGRLPGFVKTDIGKIVAILAVGGPLLLAGAKVVRMVNGIRAAFGLLPIGAGRAIARTDAELGLLGGAAGKANSKVLGLRSSLLGLAGKVFTVALILDMIPRADLSGAPGFIQKIGGLPVIGGLFGQSYNLGLDIRKGLGIGGSDHKSTIKGGVPPQAPRGTVPGTYGMGMSTPSNPGGYLTKHALRALGYDPASYGRGLSTKDNQAGFLRIGSAEDRRFEQQRHKDDKTPPPKPRSGPKTIADFVLPYQIQLDQARAQTTKSTRDDLAAAREVVAYAKKQIDSGRLSHKAMLAAMQEEASAQQQLWGAQTTAHKDAAAAKKEAAKKAQNYALPAKLQLAQARADALAAGIPNLQGPTGLQLKLARQEKAAAEKALHRHNQTIQAMIDEWGVIGQANSVLAQAAANKSHIDTYHAVSTAAVLKGVGLTNDQDMAIRERLAQRDAHRGNAPNGPAIEGHVVGGDAVHARTRSSRGAPRGPVEPGGRNSAPNFDFTFRLVGDLRKIITEVETHQRRTHQRSGGRR